MTTLILPYFLGYTDKYWNVSMTTLSWYCSSFLGYTDKYWNVSMTTLVLLILPTQLHRQVLPIF